MTETESDNPYYSKGHKNYCIYHFDRSLESFLYHLDLYLDSLESKKRWRWGSRFSRFKPIISYLKTIKWRSPRFKQFSLKPIIVFFKIIKEKIKTSMKRILFRFIKRLKYKNCILVFRAKGLSPEEIIKEILSS
ncbi:MAG: hypothetical protein ACFFDN_00365 [Candidatus Hodarchaeota archaeon]